MTPLILFSTILLSIVAQAGNFNATELEWNVNYPTDVPYEFAINPSKLGLKDTKELQVYADGKPVETFSLEDAYAQLPVLRFKVPEGTESLSLGKGKAIVTEVWKAGNIFLAPEWKTDKNVLMSENADGLLLEAAAFGWLTASARVAVPEGCAGKPVSLNIDCTSLSKMAWGLSIYVSQYDKNGTLLPEYLSDHRWTTHTRPCGVLTPFREKGRIHPQAAYLKLNIVFDSKEQEYDEYGLENKDKKASLPKLLLSRIAIRPAATLPFPKYRDSHFGKGVSGIGGDCSLRLAPDRAFWFCTRSSASWAGSVQIRKEEQCFYPGGAGTVEAWFKPDWEECPEKTVLFLADCRSSIVRKHSHGLIKSLDGVLEVSYFRADKKLRFSVKDVEGKSWSGKVEMQLPDKEWFHLAATLMPEGEASLFVNGRKVLSLPVKGYKGIDFAGSKFPNDDHALEFFLGSDSALSKHVKEYVRLRNGYSFYSGEADLLRISTGVRYNGDFTPSKRLAPDSQTRALFNFDRSFDGVNVGGAGWISGTLLSKEDRLDHRFGDIQYYPDDIPDAVNPNLQLHKWNTVVPESEDFRKAEKQTRLSFEMKPGEQKKINAPEGVIMDYLEIENNGNSVLRYPAIIRDGDVDVRSFGDMKETLFLQTDSDFQKANRVFNLLLKASDYSINHSCFFEPGSDIPRNVEYVQMQMLNGYCGFECGPLNNLAATLFTTVASFPANWTGGYGHSFEQVYFDGKNHCYDLSAQKFFPMMNNELPASLGEMEEDPRIISRWGTSSAASFIRNGSRTVGASSVKYHKKYSFRLNPGEKMRFYWYNNSICNNLWHETRLKFYDNDLSKKSHWCRTYHMIDYSKEAHADATDKPSWKHTPGVGVWRVDNFFPEYGNAFLLFDGRPSADNGAFVHIEKDSFCYNVDTSYPIVAAEYSATLQNGKKADLEISTDNGKTFRPFSSPASYQVRARSAYFIRVCAAISEVKNFKASTEFQTNHRMLPGGLKGGENLLTFKAVEGGKARINYKYHTPAKDIVFEGACNFGTYKGLTHDLMVLNPSKGLEVKVSGISKKARLSCKGNLEARLNGDILKIRTADNAPRFAYVTVSDGDVCKTLSLLVCEDARYLPVNHKFIKGEKRDYSFESLKEGKYAVLTLSRCIVNYTDPYSHRLEYEIEGSGPHRAAAGINDEVDLYKKVFGKEGEMGRWRFDFDWDSRSRYPTHQIAFLPLKNASSISLSSLEDNVEVQGILFIPEMDKEFTCLFLKNLCSTNSRPWAFEE